MDKLRNLLKQLGGSDDLVEQISEEFTHYAQAIKEKYEHEFKEKLANAKQVCLEEVNKEKAALARKVAVYLESKQETIEKAAEKQRLNEETEATNTLRRVKAMMEGVDFDSGQSRELQAARGKIERLTAAIGALKEERNMAVKKANDANGIALKALKQNRILESKLVGSAVTESGGQTQGATPAAPAPAINESASKPPVKKLDANRRQPQTAASTRQTLVENQVRTTKKGSGPVDDRITNIAAAIEE
jgi:ribosomal protein S17E